MTAFRNIKEKIITNKYLLFYFLPLSFVVFVIGFLFLRYPENTGNGVKSGISLCFSTLIPSIFPFMLLSSFFGYSGICDKWGKLFDKLTYFLFRQPGISSPVILLSMVGGLPVGARLIKQLYEEKLLTQYEGKRLLLFCINPGPAFVISGVGYYMLGSKKAGVIIYFSVVISSLIVGILTRFLSSGSEENLILKKDDIPVKYGFFDALLTAVSKSTYAMAGICAWVIIFSCITELINIFPLGDSTKLFLCCISEITCGCKNAGNVMPIPIIAGIIGFGGICAHCQIMPSILKLKLKINHFLTSRIINGAISVIVCEIALKIFPVVKEASYGTDNFTSFSSGISLPITAGLIVMCAMLLIGNNLILIEKKKIH